MTDSMLHLMAKQPGVDKMSREFNAYFTDPTYYDGEVRTCPYTITGTAVREHKFICSLGYIPQAMPKGKASSFMASFDALGIGDFYSGAWELIPFSWLVDYVVNVDKWIEQFDSDLLCLQFQDVQFGYSLKSKTTVTNQLRSVTTGKTAVASGSITTYRRRRATKPALNTGEWGFEVNNYLLTTDLAVNKDRLSILASLLAQKAL